MKPDRRSAPAERGNPPTTPLPPIGEKHGAADLLILGGVTLAVSALYLGVELRRNGVLGFPLDDPWIHLKFAKSLAHGWGFAFNQGEPVAGSTAPLWTLLLAFFHLFIPSGSAMVLVTKLLGAGFMFISAMLAGRIVAGLTRNRWAGLAAGIALATLCHFGWAMTSGMEVMLAVALVLAGVYYYLGRQQGAAPMWRAFLPWAMFALAVYARPESFLLAGFLVLDVAVRRLAFRQKQVFWRGLALYLLLLVPYFALNLSLAHSLFPQTYLAKVGRTSLFTAIATSDGPQIRLLLFKAPFMYFGGLVAHLWRANPILVLLAAVGLVVLVSQFVRRKGSLLLPLVVLFYAPLLGMTAPFVAAAFQSGRYLGAPVAGAVLAAVVGGFALVNWCRDRRLKLAVLLLMLVLAGWNMVVTALDTARNTADAESSINRMQVAVGQWLNRNAAPDAVIACNDVGAIAYFADRRIVDVLGLVTPEVMTYRRKLQPGYENYAALEYIRNKKPEYLAIFPNWFPNLDKAQFLTPVHVVEVKDNRASEVDFVPQTRYFAGVLIAGQPVEPYPSTTVVYRCDWLRQQ